MDERGRATDPLEETSSWPAVDPPPATPAVAPPPTTPPGGPSWIPPPPTASIWQPGGQAPRREMDDTGARILGAVLIVLGGWLLLRRYVDLDTELVLPIVAIAIGGLLLATGLRPRGRNG